MGRGGGGTSLQTFGNGQTSAFVSNRPSIRHTHLVHLPNGHKFVDRRPAHRALPLRRVVDPTLHARTTEGMATVVYDATRKEKRKTPASSLHPFHRPFKDRKEGARATR